MTVLERLGMTILKVNERFILGNSKYPGMFTALNALANAGRGNWALTHVLRCDFRGLNKGFKPGLDDVLAVLPEKLRESILAMDEFMGSHQGKMTVQPLKNTTLYSPWKVSYTRDGRSIYGFHVEPQRLEVYIYLNHHENVSRVGYRLKEETEQLYGWFYEHIPSRECRCPNNRRVDIGGQAKRICGLMNRLEAINPDQMTVERLKQIIIKVLEERKAL